LSAGTDAAGTSISVSTSTTTAPATENEFQNTVTAVGSSGTQSASVPGAQEGAYTAAPFRPIEVQLREVSFAYPNRPDVAVLSGVNLHIPAGKVTALVSELLNMCNLAGKYSIDYI
jgi:ABC-type multidrug transport system fused ATPase/permease subunit